MDRLTPQRLTELLKEVDHKGMFQKHKAGFGRTPSIRPVVDRTTTQITVRLSSKLRTLPEEAIRETFENVLARIYDPDLPRFGPRAVSFMQSEAFIKDVHRQLVMTQRFKSADIPAGRLGASTKRVRRLLPDPGIQLAMSYLDMGWRQEAFSLAEEFIASTDALAQCIRVDARLAVDEPCFWIMWCSESWRCFAPSIIASVGWMSTDTKNWHPGSLMETRCPVCARSWDGLSPCP